MGPSIDRFSIEVRRDCRSRGRARTAAFPAHSRAARTPGTGGASASGSWNYDTAPRLSWTGDLDSLMYNPARSIFPAHAWSLTPHATWPTVANANTENLILKRDGLSGVRVRVRVRVYDVCTQRRTNTEPPRDWSDRVYTFKAELASEDLAPLHIKEYNDMRETSGAAAAAGYRELC
ncbi:hypothetical protein RR46_00874 [Papilio xuthus]|uniref:Uncharacterized protein n=1 Tax=Papilio xuthus TaxID=66420 RepID=A0A0N1PGW4_PAPXU|nr:hypothetical protein RR46_00874 [Papilio xuthus]